MKRFRKQLEEFSSYCAVLSNTSRVGILIALYSKESHRKQKGLAYMTLKRMAKELGDFSIYRLLYHLAILRKAGLIEKKLMLDKNGLTSNTYRLTKKRTANDK
jgi:DNA-binding transcriptional ArsR family regulator